MIRTLVLSLIVLAMSPAAWGLQVERGPYLQQQSDSQIIVKWRTDTATDSAVRYGLSPESLINTTTSAVIGTEHSVKLTGLSANTRYCYSVGDTTAPLTGDSTYHFTTSPVPGMAEPTRVWVIGDSGTANANAFNVRDAYKNYTAGNPAAGTICFN